MRANDSETAVLARRSFVAFSSSRASSFVSYSRMRESSRSCTSCCLGVNVVQYDEVMGFDLLHGFETCLDRIPLDAHSIHNDWILSTHKGLKSLFVLLDEGIKLLIVMLEPLVLR